MIKDIALDPELFCQWQHHKVLRHEFSVEKGRLIAGFPKKWKKLVREKSEALEKSGELSSVKADTIRNWLAVSPGHEDQRFFASAGVYDWGKAWHLNAEDQAASFAAVLSHREIEMPNAVLADDDLNYLQDQRLMGVTQVTVQRRKKPLIDCIWPLLRISSQIRIIEPNFNPNRPRFRDTLEELLDRLHREGSNVREVEIHVRNPDDQSHDEPPNFTRQEMISKLTPLLRTGWRLKVLLWTKGREKLHARYLITDRGGVKIDWGWDEGEYDTETTPLELLTTQRWNQEWNRYMPGSADFELNSNNDIILIH